MYIRAIYEKGYAKCSNCLQNKLRGKKIIIDYKKTFDYTNCAKVWKVENENPRTSHCPQKKNVYTGHEVTKWNRVEKQKQLASGWQRSKEKIYIEGSWIDRRQVQL